MSVKRVRTVGLSGIVLLHLVACGSQPADPQASVRDSPERNERVDSSEIKAEADPPPAKPKCLNDSGSFNLAEIKWLNKLEKPPFFVPDEKTGVYAVTAKAWDVQMLPDCLPKTRVLAYGGQVKRTPTDKSFEYYGSPGPTFEMTRGKKVSVEWFNEITEKHVLPINPAPHEIPDAQNDVPFVTHVHGLEVASASDGAPNAWYTHKGTHTDEWKSNVYEYPNSQPATALWYHDHTMGMTRLNVYAGLAGMYIIRDPGGEPEGWTPPDQAHEWPLVLQDRSFKTDGSLSYTSSGNMYVVNGQVWPDMQVEPTRYRFRVLNAANSKTFTLSLTDNQEFTVIGSDGGYLAAPTDVKSLKLMNGERADILIDFSKVKPDKDSHVFLNDGSVGQFVRFTIAGNAPMPAPAKVPDVLNTKLPPTPQRDAGSTAIGKRTVTLNQANDGTYLLNGQSWHGLLSETPQVGATEDWEIVNLTSGAHPIHLHLVQFRIINRQDFEKASYQKDWTDKNGSIPLSIDRRTQTLDADAYLKKNSVAVPPIPVEAGWKDTISVPANQVTRIRVRWAPQEAKTSTPGKNPFDFDPTIGPGYVWHCHMLEHEDNEMMRQFKLTFDAPKTEATTKLTIDEQEN